MRFTFADSMIDPSFYLPLAKAAESAGYDSFAVPDNIGHVRDIDAKYPYTEDGDREFLNGKPFIEPFSLIPAMGAVTETLRFTTLVMKLPIRSPYLVAKSATSISVLTNNRFIMGVGLSPWPGDYAICGEQWKARGKRMDEMIEIIRGLSSGEFYEFKGEFYDLPSVRMQPVPAEPTPILIGGHSEAALHRAGRLGDGWMHAGGDPTELQSMLQKIKNYRKEYGRESDPFEVHAISLEAYSWDGIKKLEDAGVTDVIVGFRNVYQMEQDSETLQHKLDQLNRYADDVISAYR